MPDPKTHHMLDEALDESFPASDPLPVSPGTDEPKPLLHFMPGTCALGVHIALEWSNAPYDTREVRRTQLTSPAYLKLNPAGVVPTLEFENSVLTEASAIMLHLARRYPLLGLDDETLTDRRFHFERLVIFLGGSLHPHFWPWFVPERYGATTNVEKARVKRAAEILIAAALDRLEADLGERAFFIGDRPSVIDAYAFPMLRWGYQLDKPTSAYPNLDRLMRSLSTDPGVQKAMTSQGLPPLFAD